MKLDKIILLSASVITACNLIVTLHLLRNFNRIMPEAGPLGHKVGPYETVVSTKELEVLREIIQNYDPDYIKKLKAENNMLIEEISRLQKETERLR